MNGKKINNTKNQMHTHTKQKTTSNTLIKIILALFFNPVISTCWTRLIFPVIIHVNADNNADIQHM